MPQDPRVEQMLRAMREDRNRKPNLLQKIGAVIAVIAFFTIALLFSVVFFAAAVTLGLAAWVYFWWKTRKLRKVMRENPPGGLVIEGEVIREVDDDPQQPKR